MTDKRLKFDLPRDYRDKLKVLSLKKSVSQASIIKQAVMLYLDKME